MPFKFGRNSPIAYTWATKPSASSVPPGTVIRVTDVGVNGSLWWSNGTVWVHESPIVLLQSGIPMIFPSSGSIGNNGALTGLTALANTYSSGCYMYFEADKIAAGVPAGLYYVVMSSTTAGTIYNNTYTGGVPEIPESPTTFETTGPGAYTAPTATDITMLSVTLPGGLLGKNGVVSADWFTSQTNNANIKGLVLKYGSATINFAQPPFTSFLTSRGNMSFSNAGSESRQVAPGITSSISLQPSGGSSVAPAYTTVDSTSSQTLSIIFSKTTATDNQILSSLSLQVRPS